MNSNTDTRVPFLSQALRLGIVARAVLASIVLAPFGLAHAFNSGSTGADGVLNPAVSTEIVLPPSGILNYSSINIPTGVVVTFKRNVLNTPVQLLASGDVMVAGTIDVRGGAAQPTGTAGDGNQADDGLPGVGGPGGFDGGRGGKDDSQARVDITRGGAGLGPGGGRGGYERASGCFGGVYYHRYGAGGAFATNGGAYDGNNCTSTPPDQRVSVAKAYGSAALVPMIGGSGGGGGRGGSIYPGAGGGGGGGAILIGASGTVTITGTINASGGNSGWLAVPNSGNDPEGEGGGGAGGAIKIVATAIKGAGTLRAAGGCWNRNGNATTYCDAGYSYHPIGAGGRVRLEAESITYSGSSVPTYTGDTPSAITVSNAPVIRIASIGGSNVPAIPSGNADVSLPATTTNPVAINFTTTNVPTGNTIKLRVVPAYGEIVEVLSPAITGSTASGATSVSVNLPAGPSTLQAITSYTVTVAQAESLSRFAENEKVDRVELVASLGKGDSVAEIVTVSGKRYPVSASVLQAVGLAG